MLISFILFKLKHLLHNRIDPTVELLRKKQPILKRVKKNKTNDNGAPPIGAPSWCLNKEALEKLGRLTNDIPHFDLEDSDFNDIDDRYSEDHQNDESGDYNNNGTAESSKRNNNYKRKNKSHKQKRKTKKKRK
jgi:hypothetical protein